MLVVDNLRLKLLSTCIIECLKIKGELNQIKKRRDMTDRTPKFCAGRNLC